MAMLQSTIDVAKIHEIMARFRSIASKPALTLLSDGPSDHPSTFPSPSPSFASATTLHLHAHPCCTCKHNLSMLASLPSKRPCTPFIPPTPPLHHYGITGPHPWAPSPAPPPLHPEKPPIKTSSDLLTLSLLPPNPSLNADRDLVPVASLRGIPMERDLLQKLRQPKVIVPQPFRPIGSSITIESIILDIGSAPPVLAKKPKEVEEEMELRNRCC